MNRASGILMPITSLPSPYGIGTIGKAAYEFADFLKKAGQSYWQILPVGPTSYGDSPYQSFSTYAGNPYMIDLDMLQQDGLLKKKDYRNLNWGDDPGTSITPASMSCASGCCASRSTTRRRAIDRFQQLRPQKQRLAGKLRAVYGGERSPSACAPGPSGRMRAFACATRFRRAYRRNLDEDVRFYNSFSICSISNGRSSRLRQFSGHQALWRYSDLCRHGQRGHLGQPEVFWLDERHPSAWRAARRTISPRPASCGATRCMTGSTSNPTGATSGGGSTASRRLQLYDVTPSTTPRL